MPKQKPKTRRVALVTGAAVRVGRAFAEALAEDGYDVIVHYGKSRGEAEGVAKRIRAKGRRAFLVQAELSHPDAIEWMFEQIDGFTPTLDLLVASAARFERVPFLKLTVQQVERMLASNLMGPLLVSQAAARRMTEGHIVHLLDVGGVYIPWRGYAHYCAAKAGLAALTRCLALELAPRIRVNGMAPGTVLLPEAMPADEIRRTRERIPLGRFGSPEDLVRTLRYLNTSPFVTGQIAVVDGGRTLI